MKHGIMKQVLAVAVGSRLAEGAAFRLDAAAVAAKLSGVVMTGLLPDGVAVCMDGGSFKVEKGDGNPSGLTLRYSARSGRFTGSFYTYRVENGRLKTLRISVSGMVLDGKGYGTARAGRRGSWPITIE